MIIVGYFHKNRLLQSSRDSLGRACWAKQSRDNLPSQRPVLIKSTKLVAEDVGQRRNLRKLLFCSWCLLEDDGFDLPLITNLLLQLFEEKENFLHIANTSIVGTKPKETITTRNYFILLFKLLLLTRPNLTSMMRSGQRTGSNTLGFYECSKRSIEQTGCECSNTNIHSKGVSSISARKRSCSSMALI